MVGMLLTVIGLVMGLSGRGWIVLLIGISCIVLGIITGKIPEIYLADRVKLIHESLTPKQAQELVARHLRARGDDADDTQVFLGKFGADIDWQKRQKRK